MKKATLQDLLSEEEIKKYFQFDAQNYYSNIELISVLNLFNIGKAILPLIYPNSITDGSSIIGKTFEFLVQRAAEKGFTIF